MKWRSCIFVRYMSRRTPLRHYRKAFRRFEFRVARRVPFQIPAYAWHALEYFAIPLPHTVSIMAALAAFELGRSASRISETRLHELGYECHDESNNPAFRFFGGLICLVFQPVRKVGLISRYDLPSVIGLFYSPEHPLI